VKHGLAIGIGSAPAHVQSERHDLCVPIKTAFAIGELAIGELAKMRVSFTVAMTSSGNP